MALSKFHCRNFLFYFCRKMACVLLGVKSLIFTLSFYPPVQPAQSGFSLDHYRTIFPPARHCAIKQVAAFDGFAELGETLT
jgi:hypothetical protein